ncbi:S9 family peptidase [Dysgonomonas sp. 25]|uniref:S9 family peptidase n=1 Tax=Dysgonomonas sp. 25 TaxID=2302933 RepID=UPI0013D7AAC2|nr:S9 family peptidase [Dysgonomonas sp. 25]NDV67346.1 S9 family peptidase [Dysgonomonas sp. 25]
MKKIFALLLGGLLLVGLHAQNLELKDITAGKYYAYGAPEVVSSADGEHYYQAADKNTKIIKYSYKTGLPVETVFDAKTARECSFDSFQGFIMSPDEYRLLVYNEAESIYRHSFKAQYYYYDIRRNHVRKLTENKGKQMVPTFSRDGRMAAYVLDNNIWLAKFDYESESQVTKDGAYGKIINGATDWVYEEEFGTTALIDFSADNNLLAFVRFDESEVPFYQMQLYLGQLYPPVQTFKYPKAGEKNSTVSVQVFDINSMTTRKMKMPEQGIEYIPRIQFLPEGDELAVMTLNREQNVFAMYYANARSTVARQILREDNERYIDSELLNTIHFFGNQFTYVSEKSGYSHIYLYDNNGVQQKQLTSGNYDVTDLLAIDEEKGFVYYQAAEESPLTRAIYKVELKKGTKTKLSTQRGFNTAQFSKNGKHYINSYSNATTPTLSTVHDATGKQLRVLQDNAPLKERLASVKLPVKEFITVKAADGITDLNAYVMKPVDFNPSRKYPLVMIQYSGPNSQEVQDRYKADWTDYLTTQGFIVACVDGRGTGARGQDFRKCTYQNLGIIESDDQIAAARYFASQSYVDKDKIAIWGWSYGGYNVLMSMSRGNGIFKAGIAIAPVTDWRYYDSVYAERFMRTPQQNMDGYVDGSPKTLARNLQGNLLLIHGSADDNVHFQNSMEYAKALINADKHFDMFVFPDKDHSIRGAANRNYLFLKVTNFLKTNM